MALDLNIKQKGFMGENSVITDEYGVVRYITRGTDGLASRTLRIFAGEGTSAPEVAVVQCRQSGLSPRITITIDGRTMSVVDKTTFFTERYRMEGVGLETKGDSPNFTIMRDGDTVARARQRFLSDVYEVSVLDESFAVPVIALLLAIDAINNDDAVMVAGAL